MKTSHFVFVSASRFVLEATEVAAEARLSGVATVRSARQSRRAHPRPHVVSHGPGVGLLTIQWTSAQVFWLKMSEFWWKVADAPAQRPLLRLLLNFVPPEMASLCGRVASSRSRRVLCRVLAAWASAWV